MTNSDTRWASSTVARQMAAKAEQLGISTAQAWRLAAEMFLRPVAPAPMPPHLIE